MDDLNSIIYNCFDSNVHFIKKRDKAFKKLIKDQSLSPSYFAMYIDSAMQYHGDFFKKTKD